MSRNSLIGIVILVLILGGFLYFMGGTPSEVPNDGAPVTPPADQGTINPPGTTPPPTSTPPQAALPTAVTNPTAYPSDTTAVVSGTVNPKGAFTSYWYEYGTTSNLGNKTANQTVGSGFVAIQAPGYITNLAKNVSYYFRLVAENKYGRVAGSQYTFKTSEGTPAPVGSAPTVKTVAASTITRTAANLNGEVTPNRAATQYWFEYGKTAQLGNTSAFSAAGDGTAKMSVVASLTDLDPATTYYFRLNAQNQFGTVNGSILSFKTPGPSAPAAPTVNTQSATDIATSTATLRGTVNPNGAQTTYWFEYSTDSLLGSVLLSMTPEGTLPAGSTPSSVTADLSGLSGKTNYYFRLVGKNSQGTVRGDKMNFRTK